MKPASDLLRGLTSEGGRYGYAACRYRRCGTDAQWHDHTTIGPASSLSRSLQACHAICMPDQQLHTYFLSFSIAHIVTRRVASHAMDTRPPFAHSFLLCGTSLLFYGLTMGQISS